MNTTRMLDLQAISTGITSSLPRSLAKVGEVFNQQLQSDLPAVVELTDHVSRYRGKMLRPTLTILAGLAAVDGDEAALDSDPLLRLAAVIEMIHMATLVHDDVLDEADERRGAETVNRLRGNEAAVMLGDYLISSAFHLCSTIKNPELNEALGRVTNVLCEGELLQLHLRDDLSIDRETYLEIVRRKTAALVGASGRLGARVLGGNDVMCNSLGEYGTRLGVAFQIRDDVLDLEGETEHVGKTVGRDLEKGKLTLPVILLLDEASDHRYNEVVEVIQAKDAVSVLELVRESGALDRALSIATQEVEMAKTQMRLAVSGPLETIFTELADTVLTRTR